MLKTGEKQILQLKRIEKQKSITKEIAFFLLLNFTQGFWKDAEFAFILGKNKWKKYSELPARMAFEKSVKLSFLTELGNLQDKNKLAKDEFQRGHKNQYWQHLGAGDINLANDFKKAYESIRDDDDEKIDTNRGWVKSFPKMKEMLKKIEPNSWKGSYRIFDYLSEVNHAGLLQEVMFKNEDDKKYVWAMTLICGRAIRMLKIVDMYLYRGVSTLTKETIELCNKSFDDGIKKYFEKQKN